MYLQIHSCTCQPLEYKNLAMFRSLYIRNLHISHSAPYLPPKILHSVCFSFLLGITVVPGEIENNAHAKFWRANEVQYGRCTSGELKECHFRPCLNTLWKSPKGLLKVSNVDNSMQKPRQLSTINCAICLVGFWPIMILVKYLTIWLPCFMFSDQEQLK